MKKKLLIYVGSLLFAISLQAQNEINYTQRLFKLWTLNPSYYGGDENLRADLSYKTMWEGMEGAPRLIGMTCRLPIEYYRLGTGLVVNHEKIGFRNNSRVSLTGDVDIQLTQHSYLSLGLNLGINIQRYDSDILLASGTVPTQLNEYNRSEFIGGFGVTYRTGGWILGGGSNFMPRSANEQTNFFNVYGHLSYEAILNEDFRITPAMMVDHSNEFGTTLDLGAMWVYDGYVGLGMIYRTNRLVTLNAEVTLLPYLTVGYSYDIHVGKYSHLGKGAHEITLGFKMEPFWK